MLRLDSWISIVNIEVGYYILLVKEGAEAGLSNSYVLLMCDTGIPKLA